MSATLAAAPSPTLNFRRKDAAPLLRRAAVLGAGTMGSRIAAHLANARIPVVLLDIVPADASPATCNQLAVKAIEALLKAKPAAFYEPSAAQLITPGNLDDDIRMIHNTGAKFVGRSIYLWGNEAHRRPQVPRSGARHGRPNPPQRPRCGLASRRV